MFSDWGGKAALVTLKEFPTPEKILSTGVTGVVAAWKKEISRAVSVKRAVKLVEKVKISIGIKEGIKMAQKELAHIIEQYELYLKQLVAVEADIGELALQVPGVKEMLTIKGVGIISAAGFIAEVDDISRYSHPHQIQKLAGLNLIENSSGNHKGKTSISKRGRSKLRSLMIRVIMPIVAKNKEFKKRMSTIQVEKRTLLKRNSH